jgi:hypothetical protein
MSFQAATQSMPMTFGLEPRRVHTPSPALSGTKISKRKWKQVETIHLIHEQRETRDQQLTFHARPFILRGLPLRRPPKSQLVHRRHSGNPFLNVTAHPDFGSPFGQDRLIPIWVATLAIEQKSRTIHFDSAAQLLDFFRLPKDGPTTVAWLRALNGFLPLPSFSERTRSQAPPSSSTLLVVTSLINVV